jgi:hypothetical protein
MAMDVIGVGVGRTGTYSLKLAINRLGLGPCHHMEEVLQNMPVHVPLWSAAVDGSPDWRAIYSGYQSAVDWPTACFFRELVKESPSAKFVLTQRSPKNWADSFGSTIYKLLAGRDQAPPEMHAWLDMAIAIIAKTGFPAGLDRDGLIKAFVAHNEAVKKTILASQLLIFAVKDGWEPLCTFLDVPVPDEPFPRTNNREEFWDLVNADV